MQDEVPPWVNTAESPHAAAVDARVLAGTTIWLVAFGWYVVLQASPRGALSVASAALLYGVATFVAGLGFGSGERTVADAFRVVLDPPALVLGGLATATVGGSWFLITAGASPYEAGLWLGVALLGAGMTVGAGLR